MQSSASAPSRLSVATSIAFLVARLFPAVSTAYAFVPLMANIVALASAPASIASLSAVAIAELSLTAMATADRNPLRPISSVAQHVPAAILVAHAALDSVVSKAQAAPTLSMSIAVAWSSLIALAQALSLFPSAYVRLIKLAVKATATTELLLESGVPIVLSIPLVAKFVHRFPPFLTPLRPPLYAFDPLTIPLIVLLTRVLAREEPQVTLLSSYVKKPALARAKYGPAVARWNKVLAAALIVTYVPCTEGNVANVTIGK